MNKLTGFIKEIKSCDDIVQISIDVKGKIFTSLILSSNETYKLGEKIKSATSGMGEYIKQGVGLAIGGDIWDKAKEGFSSIITFGSDLQVALNGVQTATGTSTEAMGDMKNVMVDIYHDTL